MEGDIDEDQLSGTWRSPSLIDPSKDILAAGFIGDDALSGNQHSGFLVYKASLKKVMTYDEYTGGKRATSSGNGELENGETAPGFRPARPGEAGSGT